MGGSSTVTKAPSPLCTQTEERVQQRGHWVLLLVPIPKSDLFDCDTLYCRCSASKLLLFQCPTDFSELGLEFPSVSPPSSMAWPDVPNHVRSSWVGPSLEGTDSGGSSRPCWPQTKGNRSGISWTTADQQPVCSRTDGEKTDGCAAPDEGSASVSSSSSSSQLG